MFGKIGLDVREVTPPVGYFCSCGHAAIGTFRRGGAGDEPKPIRFFEIIKGKSLGVFCEPCLIVANYIKKRKNG